MAIKRGDYVTFTIDGREVRGRVTVARDTNGRVKVEETTGLKRRETKDAHGVLTAVTYDETIKVYRVPKALLTKHEPMMSAPTSRRRAS